MSRLRKHAATFALVAMLFTTNSAFADDSPREHLKSWLKSVIVQIFDDIRAGFPGG